MRLSTPRSLLLLSLLMVGCAPSLRVNVMQPANVNLGTARKLSVVQAEGRREAREYVIAEFIRQARTQGHYNAVDRSQEGIAVRITGGGIQIYGGNAAPPAADEVGVRLDVLDWDVNQQTRTVSEKDKNGNVVERQERYFSGRVAVALTAFTAEGRPLAVEKEYRAQYDGPPSMGTDAVIAEAVRRLTSGILHDITPRYVAAHIRVDDSDELQKPILELAQRGNVAAALEQMKAYAERNPQLPSATYNLAVLLDASGRYPEALELYKRAISLSNKDFYVESQVECQQRYSNQQALMQR